MAAAAGCKDWAVDAGVPTGLPKPLSPRCAPPGAWGLGGQVEPRPSHERKFPKILNFTFFSLSLSKQKVPATAKSTDLACSEARQEGGSSFFQQDKFSG